MTSSRALAVLLFAIGLLGCGGATTSADWVSIRRDDLLVSVDVTGKLAAVNSDVLGPPVIPDKWDYKISSMAGEGASVKKGQPVLGFDATELRQLLETKQNERDSIVKEIEKTISNQKMTRRDEELRIEEADGRLRKASLKVEKPTDLTGSLEIATAKIELELAKAEAEFQQRKAEETRKMDAAVLAGLNDKRAHAEQRIKEIEGNIAKMSIAAPRAGTVIYVSNWNDQKKKVGDSVWRAERVLETAALDDMIAKGEVDEMDASKTAVGQKVTLKVDALADTTFSGVVKSINKTVQRQSKKNPQKVVRLDITLDQSDTQRMRPGMRFTGIAEIERVSKALLIPTSAIFVTGKGPIAYKRTSRGFEAAALTLGKRNRDYAEVLGGLAEGDEVSRIDLSKTEESTK